MLTSQECDQLNSHTAGTMMEALGMVFLPSADDSVLLSMPITAASRQHQGIVHGGAYLALAETAAGAGSLHVAGWQASVCGIQVSGNHLHMSPTEGTVYARANLLSSGQTIHVWNVDITDETGTLLSTVRVVNRIIHNITTAQ